MKHTAVACWPGKSSQPVRWRSMRSDASPRGVSGRCCAIISTPVPAVWQDKDQPIDYVVAGGTGTVYSFVVHHAPKVPGRTLPFVIALVELEEGVRMLGELRGVDPTEVKIGMPVRATYIDFLAGESGPEWTLYAWEPQA